MKEILESIVNQSAVPSDLYQVVMQSYVQCSRCKCVQRKQITHRLL